MRIIYFFLVVLLGFRLAGYFLMPGQKYLSGSTVSLQIVLDREPEIVYGRQVITSDGLQIYAPIIPELHFGDKLEISGVVSEHLVISKPMVRIVAQNASNWWLTAAFTIRSRFLEIYHNSLNREEADLLSGIVLGSVGLDRQFKDKLANVGLTHVVAASGMNISLFSGFVLWWLSMVKSRRGYKVMLTTILILLYSTITGFEPPIVRAAIMAIFSSVGLLLGRQRSGLAGLLLSAYLMLWVSPKLLTSASFLLSFSAMTGQILLSGDSLKLLNIKGLMSNILFPLAKDMTQSLAAILFTFPIVIVFFAKFSLVSLFTNAFVLWTIEPLMILGAIAGILGMVSGSLAQLVALPTGVLLSFFLWVVEIFGKDPRWLLRVSGIDGTFIFGYYLILGAAILWWWDRKDVVATTNN